MRFNPGLHGGRGGRRPGESKAGAQTGAPHCGVGRAALAAGANSAQRMRAAPALRRAGRSPGPPHRSSLASASRLPESSITPSFTLRPKASQKAR